MSQGGLLRSQRWTQRWTLFSLFRNIWLLHWHRLDQNDFSQSFSPQLGAKPEKTVLGVPLYGRSFLLQNKANNGAIIVCTMMVAVTMMRKRMVKIRWTRRGGDIWHKLRYFMLLKGHKSRKETTPNRKEGALPPVCQFYHCHQIGPDIETSWSPIHLVPISALQSGLRSITSALLLVGVV